MEVLLTTRRYILSGFLALPMLIISFLGFISLGLGNVSLFVLLLGHGTVVPLLTFLFHMIGPKLAKVPANDPNWFSSSERAKLVPSVADTSSVNIVPSYWMAHVTFFFSYIISNAAEVYRMPQATGVDEFHYQNRRRKALAVLLTSIFFLLLLLGARWNYTQVENWRSILPLPFFGALAYGWYKFAATCGARPADVLGIVSLISNPAAKADQPLLCVYSPRPT